MDHHLLIAVVAITPVAAIAAYRGLGRFLDGLAANIAADLGDCAREQQ